jgi:hypothetical protein
MTKKAAKNFMRSQITEGHIDSLTGEVNCTSLAESTAHHFNQDGALDDETHDIWVWAYQVSEEKSNGFI